MFAAVVIRRHLRIVQEGEEFIAMFEQPPPDTDAVAIPTVAVQKQNVEAATNVGVRFGEGGFGFSLALFGQFDRVLQQRDERLDKRAHRLPGQFVAQLRKFAQEMDQAALLDAVEAVVL